MCIRQWTEGHSSGLYLYVEVNLTRTTCSLLSFLCTGITKTLLKLLSSKSRLFKFFKYQSDYYCICVFYTWETILKQNVVSSIFIFPSKPHSTKRKKWKYKNSTLMLHTSCLPLTTFNRYKLPPLDYIQPILQHWNNAIP